MSDGGDEDDHLVGAAKETSEAKVVDPAGDGKEPVEIVDDETSMDTSLTNGDVEEKTNGGAEAVQA